MNTADRAIVAAAEERDRNWPSQGGAAQAERDRRELLRIVREQETLAALEIAGLRHLLRERAAMDSDRADAAAEAEFLRPIGPGR